MSTGQAPPNKIQYEPGVKYNMLTFLQETHPDKNGRRRGIFKCDCDKHHESRISHVTAGKTKSCGCQISPKAIAQNTTHGHSKTHPMYKSWIQMRYRTGLTGWAKHPNYAGVTCDPRWETFEGFLENQPAGREYQKGLALARTGDIGPYSPENCRWATVSENSIEANDRKVAPLIEERKKIKLSDGRSAFEVGNENGIPHSIWAARMRNGWTVDRATTQPIRYRNPRLKETK